MPPWVEDRFSLWSLYTMLRIHAPLYMIAYRDLGGIVGQLAVWVNRHDGTDPLNDPFRQGVQDVIERLAEHVAQLPTSHLLKERVRRLRERVIDGRIAEFTYSSALDALKEMSNDILTEFQRPLFLMIPDERADYYLEQSPFGDDVSSKFPQASYDILHGSRCMAFDEWTAAVFHLMRAAEHALRWMARKLKIQNTDTKEWTRLIQDCRGKLDALRQASKTTRRNRLIEHYARALDLPPENWSSLNASPPGYWP